MYSIGRFLRQEPAVIVAVLSQWATVAVYANWITWTAEVTVAVQGAILSSLLLFYVRTATTTHSALRELSQAQESAFETAQTAQTAQTTARPLKADPPR